MKISRQIFRWLPLVIFLVLFFYISHQLTAFTELSPTWTAGAVALTALPFVITMILPLFFWSFRKSRLKHWQEVLLHWIHFSMGYINFLFVYVVIRDIISSVLRLSTSFDVSRFYDSRGLIVGWIFPFCLIILGNAVVRVGPSLKKVSLFFANLPPELENFRILHITDLHIGTSLPLAFVERLKKLTQTVPADMVVFTGDIVDGNAHQHHREIELLGQIKSRYGSFYVPGNHEFYWKAEEIFAAIQNMGATILMNQNKILEVGTSNSTSPSTAKLQISGLVDPAAGMLSMEGPNFDKTTQGQDPKAFQLLLAHQPFLADEACKRGFDLQLSGHTHGGQFFPWNLMIHLFQKYNIGLYHVGKMQLYINQGTGYWGPSLRLGTYCEVTEITLRFAPETGKNKG